MRIGIQSWGSEGDNRPLLALGAGLARRGHQVELLYTDFEPRHFERAAAALGFTATPIATPVVSDLEALTRIGLRVAKAGSQLTQSRIIIERLFNPVVAEMHAASRALVDRSDVVIGHFFLYFLRAEAERRRRPSVSVMFAHSLLPSREIAPAGFPRLGTRGNVIGWKLARFAVNRMLLARINESRAAIGVPPIRDVMTEGWSSQLLNLMAVSPSLFTKPRDWGPQHEVCGFLELPATTEEPVPPGVDAFLASGPPPVFMGFGSLMPQDDELLPATLAVWRQAATQAGCRAILQRPASNTEPLARDGDILIVSRLPHAQVFPRCTAVVHHAGAGTTHSVLRAGVPSVPVPHVVDQFFWADELRRVGVATAPLRRTRLTAARLADRLRTVLSTPSLASAAASLGVRVRAEHGVETAAVLVERAAARHESCSSVAGGV
jgi:UDP:flavonoid glycosyltransferase YjiC (YdhE family)